MTAVFFINIIRVCGCVGKLSINSIQIVRFWAKFSTYTVTALVLVGYVEMIAL